jgi:hypothetical protein
MAKGSRSGSKDFQSVSITIFIFTAVFLICNLPLFISELLSCIVVPLDSALEKDAEENPFYVWYLFLISYRVMIPVNAALNPVLYLWRMQKFQKWIVTGPRQLAALEPASQEPTRRSFASTQASGY